MSASFHNAQGWLRWYRVHNAVEVVGLAYLFVLLVNEHSYGHGIAVIALLLFLVRQFGVRVKSDPS